MDSLSISSSLLDSVHYLVRRFTMEIVVSAVTSDLVSRFVSFLIEKYRKQTGVEKQARLQRVLLRAQTIIEEAEGRHITNQGMLLQLKLLAEGMYQGNYVLDTFKYRTVGKKTQVVVSHSSDLSSHHHCIVSRVERSTVIGSDGINELRSVLESLETTIGDMKEFIIFLGGCPRLPRQLYSTYLFIDRCLFGRHVEREQIINFLLARDSFNAPNLGVLPIIGPCRVGKRTLVEHVCNDERVHNHFSQIMHFNEDDLRSPMLSTPGDNCEIEHQKFVSSGKSLYVIKFIWDVDKVAWRRFCSSVSNMASGSKIIIISRIEKVSDLGTVQPIRLKKLSQEQYWYFFKVLAFGSTNPAEHPELTSLAMEIATELKGSFLGANIWGGLLRANLNPQFWCHVLESLKESMQQHFLLFGEHAQDLIEKNRPSYACKVAANAPICLLYNYIEMGFAQRELPKVRIQDILTGSIIPREEKFDILVWQSPIPPYCNYTASCLKEKPQRMVARKKCLRRKGRSHKLSDLHLV